MTKTLIININNSDINTWKTPYTYSHRYIQYLEKRIVMRCLDD